MGSSSENPEHGKAAGAFLGIGDRVRLILRAFRYRNYILFFGGQGISLIGSWMQVVAMSWLVYRLTNSSFLLGLVGFLGQIPALLVMPFAGVFADRLNRRSVLIVTQTAAMLQAFALAFLVLTGTVTIPIIIALGFFLGVVNAFDAPTRQAFVVEMVERREDLGNAIALNSVMFNSARLIGPSIAGIVIALVGEGICFLINGLSYLAVIAALAAMRIAPRTIEAQARGNVLKGLGEGFRYAFGLMPIRDLLLLLALVSLVGMPSMILAPVFAKDILHGGPHTLGFLMAASGVGALTGALALAARRTVRGLTRKLPFATGIFAAGLIGLSLSRHLALSMCFMALAGFGMIFQMASVNTILQTIVDDEKRGRVMSFYALAFFGMAPFGSLLAGAVAGRIGAPATVLISGSVCMAGAIMFATRLKALREQIRIIYRRKGIISEDQVEIPPTPELSDPRFK